MQGRYGSDDFSRFLSFASLAILFAGAIVGLILGRSSLVYMIFYLIALALMGCTFFRTLSRNIDKRFAENQRYLKIKNAFLRFIKFDKLRAAHKLRKQRRADKTHIYEKCPYCKSTLRLPKVKGKHSVNCPCCHKSFGIKI